MPRTVVSAFIVSLLLWTGAVNHAQSKPIDLKLTPQNIHWGYYDAKLKPVLRISSGDTVRVETMVAKGLGARFGWRGCGKTRYRRRSRRSRMQ